MKTISISLMNTRESHSPFWDPDEADRRQTLRLSYVFLQASLLLACLQILVVLSNNALVSKLILLAIVGLVVANFIGRQFILSGKIILGIKLMDAGVLGVAIACALVDPQLDTVLVFAPLMAIWLSMSIFTSQQLRSLCFWSGATILFVGFAGTFIKIDAFHHISTLVSNVVMLVALLLAAGLTLFWLYSFHTRLSALVIDLKWSRDNLEQQVAQRTARLSEELERAKKLERELRKTRRQVVIIAEDERRHLRRELHDEFSPALAGCVLSLERLRDISSESGSVAQETINRVCTNLQAVRDGLRGVAYLLIPEFLDLGLCVAIRQIAESFMERHPAITIDLDFPESPPELPAAVERSAYFVVQNALRNVEHHAEASHCEVRLSIVDSVSEIVDERDDKNRSQLRITISDNGKGLPFGYRPGVGILAMSERAEMLGGTVRVCELQPQGIMVELQIPLNTEGQLAEKS